MQRAQFLLSSWLRSLSRDRRSRAAFSWEEEALREAGLTSRCLQRADGLCLTPCEVFVPAAALPWQAFPNEDFPA